jgi:hypothetical protein
MLARAVGSIARLGYQPTERGNIDDVPVALPCHELIREDCAVDNAQQVDIKHPTPLLHGQISRIPTNGDAGVVDHVIQAPILGHRGIDQVRHLGGVGHVDVSGPRLRAALLKTPGDRTCGILVDIGDDDRRTPTPELLTQRLAQTHSSAGDDGDRVLKPLHARHLLLIAAPVGEPPAPESYIGYNLISSVKIGMGSGGHT